jgi:NAD(P)-dependent dehydrogenase (short-subunit alcohol dehydrogenase family)
VIRSSHKGRPGRPSDSVLVTGTSTGLGLETALHLADAGFRVYAGVRDPASADVVERAAADRGVALEVVHCDLGDPESMTAAAATVVDRTNGIYALINNGGIGLRGAVEDSSDEEIRRVFETNVFGTITLIRAVLPHMRAANCGRIVTVTSVGGRVPGFGVSIYCSSKFAQEGLGEGMALELAPFGIQSILVEPGIIKTERWARHRGTAHRADDPTGPYYGLFWASEAMADKIVERSPTRPADVARTIHEALTAEAPRLRYVVGRGASIVISLRRHLPEPVFERLYFGGQLRRVERDARRSAGAEGAR